MSDSLSSPPQDVTSASDQASVMNRFLTLMREMRGETGNYQRIDGSGGRIPENSLTLAIGALRTVCNNMEDAERLLGPFYQSQAKANCIFLAALCSCICIFGSGLTSLHASPAAQCPMEIRETWLQFWGRRCVRGVIRLHPHGLVQWRQSAQYLHQRNRYD